MNEKAIHTLKGILSWSDRIGSDEIIEINNAIAILNKESKEVVELLKNNLKALDNITDLLADTKFKGTQCYNDCLEQIVELERLIKKKII